MDTPEFKLPAVPAATKKTVTMAGILVDVYGLAERHPHAKAHTIVWLHHARTRTKEIMTSTANQIIHSWKHKNTDSWAERSVICMAYDQRNHGTRVVDFNGNKSWKDGNEKHAQDLVSGIVGMVADMRGLMGVLEGYIFTEEETQSGARVDQQVVLGKSLGGHTAWEAIIGDARVGAIVPIVGCPDIMGLLSDRARRGGRPTWKESDGGASFLGSSDFPPSLVQTCQYHDVRGILFGTNPPAYLPHLPPDERTHVETVVQERLGGKKIFAAFGETDTLVPWLMSSPMIGVLSPFSEKGVLKLEHKVYPATGHSFTDAMMRDSLVFLEDVFKTGPFYHPEY